MSTPQHQHHEQATNYAASTRGSSSAAEKPRIGPYVIVKTLGEGSFGKVKLAVHQQSGQKVALKIISRKKLLTKDMAGRIDREIEFLQLLRHPHIIKLYTVVTTATEIIMVIEYAGRELFDYIVQHGRMSEHGARRFFQQIISAVEYCHRHKIAHRDLKPENLLLDDQLNVKIADFGLSNIMQDGNFLKTSCGSPNYAAPEVINGKLYAGPEVDVWSCGVILYVLLCGRLPFDDEFIPTLFKKIAQGQYTIPPYLSPEAANLLRKMLVVNPLQRITVAEIRQDPWFVKDLPEYLRPPKEEFFDTGVDLATIAKNARSAASGNNDNRGRIPAHDHRLHESVLGRLGKTMGYAKDDVHDALVKKEPNPIKDAYMLVRENQMILNNSRQSNAEGMQSFLAQSPPPWTANPPGSPTPFSLHQRHHSRNAASPLTLTDDHLSLPPSVMTVEQDAHDSISILPSSLPEYHRAFMQGQSSAPSATTDDPGVGGAVNLGKIKPTMPVRNPAKPSPLTPLSSTGPQAVNQPKRPRLTRWQFGIRSRNLPLEAIACIYRALKRMGAEWVETPREPSSDSNGDGDGDGDNDHDSDGDGENDHDGEGNEDEQYSDNSASDAGSERNWSGSGSEHSHSSSSSHRSHVPKPAQPPKDPWLINVRFLKPSLGQKGEDKVYVYITIQLYQLERGFYLVDFRCGGYELEGAGGRREKKEGEEVASPFPFLEVASGLICALAEAGE